MFADVLGTTPVIYPFGCALVFVSDTARQMPETWLTPTPVKRS
jgi:hypothetical protein